MNVMSDYRFPTKDEESALIEKVLEVFAALGMEPRPLMLEEFASLLFSINPDAFGDSLENAERWLQECVERAEKESEGEQAKQMRRFLVDFPTTTMH